MNISSYPGQGTPYGYRHELIDGFGLQYVLGETSHTTTPEERELAHDDIRYKGVGICPPGQKRGSDKCSLEGGASKASTLAASPFPGKTCGRACLRYCNFGGCQPDSGTLSDPLDDLILVPPLSTNAYQWTSQKLNDTYHPAPHFAHYEETRGISRH